MNEYYSESKTKKYVITNKSGSNMTSEDFAKNLFMRIIRDAKDRFVLTPGKSIQIECHDDWENLFDAYLINNFDNAWGNGDAFMSDDIGIKLVEER